MANNNIPARIQDERVPKLFGLLCLFLALYIFIAITSYIFTGGDDHDLVVSNHFGLLFQTEVQVENFLGRLGAVVSDFLVYWLFGLPSYAFVFILFVYGMGLINRVPISRYHSSVRSAFILMIVFSILFGFIFRNFGFQMGGEVGRAVSDWLTNLLGIAGVIALIIFILAILLIWNFNPDFQHLTPAKAWEEFKGQVSDTWNSRYRSRGRSFLPVEEVPLTDIKKTRVNKGATNIAPTADAEVSVPFMKEETAFDITSENKASKPGPLKTGGAELEIDDVPPLQAPASDMTGQPAPTAKPYQPELFQQHIGLDQPYDSTLDLSAYEYPVLPLLHDYDDQKVEIDRAELEANKDQIIETLLNYKIEIVKIRATIGPTVTLYEIIPAPGVRISRIKNLEDDIALSLAALGIRIIAPIPGRGTIGIEVPNKNKQIVSLKELLASDKFRRGDMDLPIVLGKTISNEVFVADLTKMPHLLIAGATGQGKSVGINVILMSLLYKKHPSQVKIIMIDPKKVELSPYGKLENHFLAFLPDQPEPIITDTSQVVNTLNSLTIEMDSRYNLLKKANARNIKEYNEKFVGRKLNPENGHRFLPFIVLVIDEFADLIMTAGKEIELPIGRLAQLSRAVGIHLIIATQRPSVNIITGVIKANFPVRLAFKVASKIDSRTILDAGGAEQLIGRGDMLLSYGSDIIRLQCAFVDTPEVERVIEFISQQQGYPEPFYLPEFNGGEDGFAPGAVNPEDLDEMFEDAARLVVQNQHGSTSMIQRRLKLGYNRAGRIMDQLEAMGIVGPNEGSKPREVLFFEERELDSFFEQMRNKR